MLYPIPDLIQRARLWHEVTGNEIKVVISDLAKPNSMMDIFNGHVLYDWAIEAAYTGLPDTIVHYADIPQHRFQ